MYNKINDRRKKEKIACRESFTLLSNHVKYIGKVIVVLFCVFYANSMFAQTTTISFKFSDRPLETVFKEIEQATGFKFVYSDKDIPVKERVSLDVTNENLEKVLQRMLEPYDVSFRIQNRHIALYKNENRIYTGDIRDSLGEPVIGANIIVKRTQVGTITDIDGHFSINATEGDILQISYIGYLSQEYVIDKQATLSIILQEDRQLLEEVVVIGYGTVRKKDLTGAITQVKVDNYSTQQSTNVLDFLNGTVAGFNSNIGTSAAGSNSMEIRGASSIEAKSQPLIVLDGVIFNGELNDINPADIETVDVLKDASSAAVYGSRSAAGVLIINTKQGRREKVTVNLSMQLGISDQTRHMRVNNVEQYLQQKQDYLRRRNVEKEDEYYTNPNNLPPGVSLDEWQNYDASYSSDPMETWLARLTLRDIEKQNYLNGRYTDWYDEATRPGIRQNYNMNLSGGSEKTNYYWSLGYTNNEIYMKGDEFQVIRTRINADTKVTDYLKLGVNAQFSAKDQSSIPLDLTSVIRQSPLGQIYDEDGTMKWYTHDDSGITNPFLQYAHSDKLNIINTLFANMYADLRLPFGFNYKLSFINRYEWEKNYLFHPSTIPDGNETDGSGERKNYSLYEWQVDHILSWRKTFGVHDFYATFLFNAEKKQTWEDITRNVGFSPSESLGFHQLAVGSSPTITNNDTYATGTALMGRINYTLLDRYLLTLSIRRDGYSAFGTNNPYATFPAGAIAWNISDESFFRMDWMNNLKLRVSYGVNGNREIGMYDALASLSTTKYLADGNYVGGVANSSMANRALKWEKTASFNTGVDFGIFSGRINGTVDFYHMVTTDLLLKRSLPQIIGYASVMSNMGELQNRGFEMTLNSLNVNTSNVTWNSSFTFSLNRNKIKKLYGDMIDVIDDNGNVTGQREADDIINGWFIGEALDRIWDYKFLGIYQLGEEEEAARYGKAPGDTKLYDKNDDGVIDTEDKEFLGYRDPRFRLGLQNNITLFRNWQISFFLRADLGHSARNSIFTHTSSIGDRINSYHLPYWTPDNPINTHTRLATVNTPEFQIYQSRSFLRLQDISVAYTLPVKVTNALKIGGCKIYLNARNLFTITKWSGWDPESLNTPMPRIYTFGIDVTL
ncbi:MAG: TonB-dependent receptor [Tannerellaceae bacterium]|nr:TonB-dependent receptor [Tannerellaceae bacterium]